MGRKLILLSLVAFAITGVVGGMVLAASLSPMAQLELDNRKIQNQLDELKDMQPWKLCVTGGVHRPPKKIQPPSAYEVCEDGIRERRTKKIEMTLLKIDKQRSDISSIETEDMNSAEQLLLSLMVQRASGARFFMLGEERINDASICAIRPTKCGKIPNPAVEPDRYKSYRTTHATGLSKAQTEYEVADSLIQNAFCKMSDLPKLTCIEPEFREYDMMYDILTDIENFEETPKGAVN